MRPSGGNLRVLLLIWCWCCGPLWSQESGLTLEQLNHRAFRVSDGASALVQALAQTRDGTLWVGSSTGLFHFDGAGFVRYPGASDDPLPSMGVIALISSPDGGYREIIELEEFLRLLGQNCLPR
jgi:hypothetical protein